MIPIKMGLDLQTPRHHLVHFCCAKLSHSKSDLFLISPSVVVSPGISPLADPQSHLVLLQPVASASKLGTTLFPASGKEWRRPCSCAGSTPLQVCL